MTRRLYGFYLAIGVLALLVFGLLQTRFPSFLGSPIDERLYRFWGNQVRAELTTGELGPEAERLLVVVIDDQSLETLGLTWPIPRGLYPAAVAKLKEAGAKTIGLDLVFPNPGPDPEQDAQLAATLAEPDVFCPFGLVVDGDRLRPLESALHEPMIRSGFALSQMEFAGPGASGERIPDIRFAVLGIQREVTDMLGFVVEQQGQAVREEYYAFSVALMAHFQGLTPAQLLGRVPHQAELHPFESFLCQIDFARIRYLPPGLTHQRRRAPEVALAEGEIRFVEPRDDFALRQRKTTAADLLQVVSLLELLTTPSQELAERFEGKPFLAILGIAAEAQDLKTTPVGDLYGVEVQANILLNLALKNFILELPRGRALGLVLATVLLGLCLAVVREPRLAGLGILLLVLLYYEWARRAYLGGGYLSSDGLAVPVGLPVLAMVSTFCLALVVRAQQQRANIERVLTMLREVCPVQDLDLLEQREGIQLGGEERELTILFSDLRGYTSFAEKLDSLTVLRTLNEYFGTVGAILESHGGCVFDYQGDAQMVVFGLMEGSRGDHATAACQAAAEMVLELNRKRAEWAAEGRAMPETGVGIVTGKVSFGFLGTAQRKQRVAIGDPTNTAARIQGKSAEMGHAILLSQSTLEAAGRPLPVVKLPAVELKGKEHPLQIYAIDLEAVTKGGFIEATEGRNDPESDKAS
ncbi:MAG: CHASE2 domain-containing protein [Vulcanimicrobiota bacterium]